MTSFEPIAPHIFALLFTIAAATRRRLLWFLDWFVVLTPLPVLFIPPRSFFVMYLPLPGMAMFAATALVWVQGRLFTVPSTDGTRGFPVGVCLLAIVYGLADAEFRVRTSEVDSMSGFIELSKQDFMLERS